MRLVRPSEAMNMGYEGPELEAYPTYSSGATYALGDRVLFTETNAVVNIYESAQGSNTGHGVMDPAWWTFVSAANPYRMFDTVVNSQTTAADEIATIFFAVPLANTVALLNVSGVSARVDVYTNVTAVGIPPTGDLVYSETKSLVVAGDGVSNWYEYFFGDLARRSDVLFTDLPSYPDEAVVVTLSGPGETVAIGTLAVGYGYYLGETVFPTREGLIDYSRKEADAFGQFSVVERPFSKRGNFTFIIDQDRVPAIKNLMPQFRAKACVWIPDDDDGSSSIYGFYKDYEIGRADENSPAVATIELEGLS